MKTTALTSIHRALGAKMVPFAGYEMPVQYAGLLAEHHAVRTAAGVFDVSHMGEFFLDGPGALDLIQKVTSNDASKLTPGKVQYSCLPNLEGGIVDDLLVYMRAENSYLLVVNASNIEKDWNWIQSYAGAYDCTLVDKSDDYSLLAVQGPQAAALLQPMTSVDLASMTYYTFVEAQFLNIPHVILSATGYTGAGGFEIYIPNEYAEKAWNAILAAGIVPIGLGARDTLRLEMGYCLYGNDINDTTSPLEAGLGWITKFTKEFNQRATLEKQKAEGVTRKLVGFEMIDRGIPRHDYPITTAQGEVVGVVTSGTQSPSLNKAIGLGYVPVALSTPESEIFVEIRGKYLKAKVISLPFYKN